MSFMVFSTSSNQKGQSLTQSQLKLYSPQPTYRKLPQFRSFWENASYPITDPKLREEIQLLREKAQNPIIQNENFDTSKSQNSGNLKQMLEEDDITEVNTEDLGDFEEVLNLQESPK